MKQSSIEFLIEMTKPVNWKLETWKEHYKEVFQKAKEMHKQEIIEACEEFLDITLPIEVYKEYYENTYEKEN